MSMIKIETLTPVHVGSGVFLQKGNDYVCGRSEDGDDVIAIINMKKALGLIGESNIGAWVNGIEKGRPINEIVRQFAPKAKLEDYSDRIIMRWSNKSTETLKEFIHDGMGRPYIPGSSLKGAIRTAVLASVAKSIHQKEEMVLKKKWINGKEEIKGVTAKAVEARAFGRDPNNDVFRLLQVGDAIFGSNYEAATRLVNLNERGNKSYWDESKPQLVEVLTDGDTATFDLKLCMGNTAVTRLFANRIPACMNDIETLFKTINAHTLSLLESEIEYWKERMDDPNADNVDEYVKKLAEIENQAKECEKKPGTCVMRLGHGSGWRFITGAWAEKLNNFENVIVDKSRPNNNKYQDFDFPKSRRVDEECELLGFVKLTIAR